MNSTGGKIKSTVKVKLNYTFIYMHVNNKVCKYVTTD